MTGRAGSSDRSFLVPRPLDFAFGAGVWTVATATLVGNPVLPGTDAGFAVVLACLVV